MANKKTTTNIIKIAKNEVGYLEKKSNKYLNHKTKNAGKNNYTKYNAVFGVNGCYWCCYFICWLFYTLCDNSKTQAKKILCGCLTGACETLRQTFKRAKRYYSVPKVGDLVFFKGSRHAGANHIALIYKVTSKYIYTIEGNTSGGSTVVDNGGGVAKKKYLRTYSKILGYGRPKYESENTASPVSKPKPNTNTSSTSKPVSYYKKYTGKSTKIDTVLKSIGVPEKYRGSYKKRKPVATKNGIGNYNGTSSQNLKLVNLAKSGKLKKV